jgi:TDG/mug DNA glycosylase family protein
VTARRTRRSPLPDHLAPGLRAVFVGINPGLRSAETGRHYAGPANRFWTVMTRAGLLPEPWRPERDAELLALGFGLTNIVARPTRGAGDLGPEDFRRGRLRLRRLLRRHAPGIVVFVGITVFDRVFGSAAARRAAAAGRRTGLQVESLDGIPVWVVPNPSGRNAHWTPEQMVRAYRDLRRWLETHSDMST